jgi:hypothetical protein
MIDPNRFYLCYSLPAKGKSGGVLSGIKCDRFDVGAGDQGEFILQHNLWDKELEVKWNLLNVYGVAQDDNKESFLVELASFCSKSREPYNVGELISI